MSHADDKPSKELLEEFSKHAGFPMVDPDIDDKGWEQLIKSQNGPRVRQMIARLQKKAEEDRQRRRES